MTSPVQSHFDNFVVNLNLGLLPTLGFVLNFSDVLIIDKTANSPLSDGSLNASTIVTDSKLATFSETQVIPSGQLGTIGALCVSHFFGAKFHPRTVKFVSIGGSDTYATVANYLESNSVKFHSVICASKDQDDIKACVEAFNSNTGGSHPVFAGVTGDADNDGVPDILDADASAAVKNLATIKQLSAAHQDQVYVSYHNLNAVTDGVADWAEICALYASTDWNNEAAGGNLVLTKTKAMTVNLSQANKDALDALFVNHALPMFGTETYVDAGVMVSGRPVYHIFTRDWLENRLQLAVAEVKAQYANLRRKLPMDSQGQSVVLNKIKAVMQNALRAKHTLRPSEAERLGKAVPYESADPIDATALNNKTLTFTVLAYFLEDARKITINAFVTS